MSQQADRIANLPQSRVEKQAHANPALHALHVSLERSFKIRFDDFDDHLGSIGHDRSVNLPDARCSKGLHFDALKMVHEPFRSKPVEQLLRVLFGNGGRSAVELLKFNAALGFDQIRSQSEDLSEFDGQQSHGLDGVDVNGFLPFELTEEAEERTEFHGITPAQSWSSMVFSSCLWIRYRHRSSLWPFPSMR